MTVEDELIFDDIDRLEIKEISTDNKNLEDWYFDVLKLTEEKEDVENSKI